MNKMGASKITLVFNFSCEEMTFSPAAPPQLTMPQVLDLSLKKGQEGYECYTRFSKGF